MTDLPVTPYDGGTSSGWSGSETSRRRAEFLDSSGKTQTYQQRTLALIESKEEFGIVCKEVQRYLDIGHGTASGCLSNLHQAGLIRRLTEERWNQQVYVLPEWVLDREEAPFKRNRNWKQDYEEVSALSDRQSELLTGVAAAVNGPPPPLVMWSHADLPERVQALREVALGRVRHLYRGGCPDTLDGWDIRDPDCPACKALGGGE